MTHILLIRHGESLWNREGRLQGNSDSPLTETGMRQAQLLARHLAQLKFAALYSSDSGRALETARAVSALTGHEIIVDTGLRERHFGVFEGLTRAELESLHPEAYACFRTRDPAYCIPGGESALAFSERALKCLNDIAVRHAGDTVVVVTHGLVLDVMYRNAYQIALTEPRTFELVHAGVNRLQCAAGRWRVHVWGDADHLNDTDAGKKVR